MPSRLVPQLENISCGVSSVENLTISCQAAVRQIFHLLLVTEQFLVSVPDEMFL